MKKISHKATKNIKKTFVNLAALWETFIHYLFCVPKNKKRMTVFILPGHSFYKSGCTGKDTPLFLSLKIGKGLRVHPATAVNHLSCNIRR
jgi:hypothetical protein